MLTELIIELTAKLIYLAIVISPIVLIIKIIESAKRKTSNNQKYKGIKIHKASNKQTGSIKQQDSTQEHTSYPSGWWWNEETKLWEPPENLKKPTSDNEEIDYKNAYQARYIFTKNEWQNYKKLRDIAEIKGYIICPKVRLLDIIEPKKGEKKYKTLFYKIQAKHVDFVICDKDMRIKGIIELDDNSHNNKERKERDEFVNMILQSVGYKVIHTRYITNDILDLV